MEIYKRPDSKFWIADFFVGSRRIRRSTKQTKRSAATEVAAEMLRIATAKLEAPAPAKPKPMPTIAQFIDSEFAAMIEGSSLDKDTKHYYRNGCRLLKAGDYRDTLLDQVYPSDVDALRFPGGPSTANNVRRTLSRILSHAVEKRVLLARPKIRLLEEVERSATYTAELEEKVIAMAEQPLRDVFLIAFDAGMRPDEVLRLCWDDVIWDKSLIFIPTGKTKASRRHVPLSDRVRQVLRTRAQGSKSPFVFPAIRKSTHGHMSYRVIHRRFKELRSLAGIPDDIVLYSARHTFATDLLDQSGNMKLVQETLGHTDMRTTGRYLHPSKRGLAEVIDQRNARRAAEAERHVLRHGQDSVQ
jgi:integrase